MDYKIGDTVTYIRHNKDGISEGTAVLKGIGLDPDNRIIVLLKEGDAAFNTFSACVNPTEEFKEEFRKHSQYIEDLSKEGNAKAKTIIEDYNARIQKQRDEILGVAVGA